MSKTKEELERDKILTILKHSGEISYADLLLRGGSDLASSLIILVQEGKVNRRLNGGLVTLYSLAIQTVDDVIKLMVTNKPTITGVQLVCDVIEYIHKNNMSEEQSLKDVPASIEALVETGELVEVEYVLPSADYRVKSCYFPKGTRITLPG